MYVFDFDCQSIYLQNISLLDIKSQSEPFKSLVYTAEQLLVLVREDDMIGERCRSKFIIIKHYCLSA